MREKEQSTAELVEAKFQADIKAAREAFDQRLLAEAEKLASLSKESSQHHEFYYPFGMLAVPPMPFAHWLMPLWVAEGAHPGLVGSLVAACRSACHRGARGYPKRAATSWSTRLRLQGIGFANRFRRSAQRKNRRSLQSICANRTAVISL